MKLLLKISFLLLTWFTNLVNATPVFTKVVLPSYELAFSKTKIVKKEILFFPAIEYQNTGVAPLVTFNTTVEKDGVSKEGKLSYHPFQPVYFVTEKDKSIVTPSFFAESPFSGLCANTKQLLLQSSPTIHATMSWLNFTVKNSTH